MLKNASTAHRCDLEKGRSVMLLPFFAGTGCKVWRQKENDEIFKEFLNFLLTSYFILGIINILTN